MAYVSIIVGAAGFYLEDDPRVRGQGTRIPAQMRSPNGV
jgi:hypothetical protein